MDNKSKEYDELMNVVKQTATDFFNSIIVEKENLISKIQELKDTNEQLKKQQSETDDWKKKQEFMEKRTDITRNQLPVLESKLNNLDNLIKSVQNNGSIASFQDKLGNEIPNIPDFRNISTEKIVFDQETILVDSLPIYIPIIDEQSFKNKGCVFDAIRVAEDSYLLAPFKYEFGKENYFVIVTLDQLMLANLYYITKLKAQNQAEADRKTQRNIDHYFTISRERREKHFSQKGYYRTLSAKIKKSISEEEWNNLSLDEKEKLDIPVKHYGPERIKSKLQDGEMWFSFHVMYNQFVNPKSLPFVKKGLEYIEIPLGQKSVGIYSNKEVHEYWIKFRDMMEYKIKDIQFQREEISENYKTALETSFGESNTKNTLLADYGVLVKRQNGDEINVVETEQIQNALNNVFSIFGNLQEKFLANNIKISHTGKKLVFARKAVGVYVPMMGTIGVSDKYGDLIFNSVMAHEVAHFIDNKIGEKTGKRYETDNYESTAGIIAFTFRNNMNKPKKQQTDYINATKECFARAMEQYFTVTMFGDDVEIVYVDSPLASPDKIFTQNEYVNKVNFYEKIKPLIDNFLVENSIFLGDKNQFVDANKMVNNNQQLQDTIDGLEILLETAKGKNKTNIIDTIEGLKLLIV
jgi:hypothetical protein